MLDYNINKLAVIGSIK